MVKKNDYWSAVSNMCKNYVLKTVDFMKSRDPPFMDMAEKDFYKLITENSISKLILEAQKNYEEKTIIPVFVEELKFYK